MKKEKKDPKVNTVVEDGEGKIGELEAVAPAVAVPAVPREGTLKVTARQFTQARGIRWERAAGFLHWAGHKYGQAHRLAVKDWIEVYEEFGRTPVGR